MRSKVYKPSPAVMRRVEELLHEQLQELGQDPSKIDPHEISLHMRCGVHPDGALSYAWKGEPILDVTPEESDDGSVHWRFYTPDFPRQ